MPRRSLLLIPVLCSVTLVAAGQQPAPQPPAPQPPPAQAPAQAPVTNLGNDANGNPRRLAVKTGHISNYDETKVKPYTLPDALVPLHRVIRPTRLARRYLLRMLGGRAG